MRRKSIAGVVSNHYFRVNATTFLKSEKGAIQLSIRRHDAPPVPTIIPVGADEYIVRVYDDQVVLENANESRVLTAFQADQRADRVMKQNFPGTKIIDKAISR